MQTEGKGETEERIHEIMNERDKLIGENNYLKKKIQSITSDNEKLKK